MSKKKIHDIAFENLRGAPITFVNIVTAICGDNALVDIDRIDINDYVLPVFILSNKQMTKGAIMALNPDVMNKIIDKFGEVYIIPSSTEEVLIIPKNTGRNVSELVEMVKAVNSSEVKPEERLSDNIYEYDRENKVLRIAE